MKWAARYCQASLVFLALSVGAFAQKSNKRGEASSSQLQVLRILPQGDDTPQRNAITITFNHAMVPLGRMERTKAEVPVDITPAPDCSWVWISPTSLSCQLGEGKELKWATRYSVKVRAGTADLSGQKLAIAVGQSFSTQIPKVSYQSFGRWFSPGYPVVSMNFNMPVFAQSLEQSMIFVVNGKATIAARVVARTNSEMYGQDFTFEKLQGLVKSREWKPQDAGREWVVVPAKELPLASHVAMQIRPGLRTPEGLLTNNESKNLVEFDTFGPFQILGVACGNAEDGGGEEEGGAPKGLIPQECDPLARLNLQLSAPATRESIAKNCKVEPFKDAEALQKFWEDTWTSESLYGAHKAGHSYSASMPPLSKARSVFTLSCGADLTDVFSRKLGRPVSINIALGARKPQIRLGYEVGVLEKQIDSEIPLYITNLSEASATVSTYTSRGGTASKKIPLSIQKIDDLSYALPLGLRGILGDQSGAAFVEVNGTPAPSNAINRKGFFEVTPYYVHVKEGHYNTLVWVRDMATGKAVSGAEVSLIESRYRELHKIGAGKYAAKTNGDGIAYLPGYSTYDPKRSSNRYEFDAEHFMVKVTKGDSMALAPLNSSFSTGISSSGGDSVYSSNEKKFGHLKVWGTTAQGVYRAGDKIEFKIYVREQNAKHFVPAPQGVYKLVVRDPTGQEVFKKDKIRLNEFGAFHGDFKTAKSAAVGWYEFILTSDFLKEFSADWEKENPLGAKGLHALSVLVSDFTPAPFRVENDLDRTLYEVGDSMKISSHAKLHSGGPYGEAGTRVHVSLQQIGFAPDSALASQYAFSCGDEQQSDKTLFEKEEKLNKQGELSTSFKLEEEGIQCGRLFATSDVSDDRGKKYSAVKEARYFAVNRFVGLRSAKDFFKEGESVATEFIVVDPTGKLVPNTSVSMELQKYERKVARVKGAGNAYLEESKSEWVPSGSCEKKSGAKPQECSFKSHGAGSYKIIAHVKDSHGHENKNEMYVYVTGSGPVMWEEAGANGLRIIPENLHPKVGEKAKFLVQNPYPNTEALITVERYGILRSWTQKFKNASPVVEFEIEEDDLPGFYLSVLVFSPRVEKPLGAGQVDLGKPAFRMGYIKVVPDNPAKEIAVKVVSDHPQYKPRDKVKVSVEARTRRGRSLSSPVEYAVAVLDEAVFDLIAGGRKYFDVYKGFYDLDQLDVTNHSLLMALVGRQKFEKKGANAGGDGGGLSVRNIFKYVAYWNPSLKADSKGRASFQFEVPDNLTGWRVLAMAVTPEDRMGLGEGTFKVNKPTELRPVMPNVVNEGDDFKGVFSVMNRLDKKRTLKVSIQAQGDMNSGKAQVEKTVEAEPFKRILVEIPVRTSLLKGDRFTTGGKISFVARAGDSIDTDAMTHEIEVHKKRTLITAAAYGSTTEAKASEALQFPKNIYTDIGDVSLTATATVIGNLEGAFRYMADYPYLCWEQRLTKGTAASSYGKLKEYLDPAIKWKDSDSVLQTMFEDAPSFQAPNGGMVYYVAQDAYVSPYLSAYTGLAFDWLRVRNQKAPAQMVSKLQGYLKNLLKQPAFPTFYSKGMASTVRAVALAALARAHEIKSSEVERYRSHLKEMDLFGRALYLQAALEFADRELAAKEALTLILGTADESAGKFRFNETLDFGWVRIHSSELRTQCSILSALSKAASKPWAKEQVGDIPYKLVRFITQSRGARDHWENTQENAFCSEALIDYSRQYEAQKPDMKIVARVDSKKMGEGALRDYRAAPLVFRRPIASSDPGRKTTLAISRSGTGRLYYQAALSYAPKEDFSKPRMAGLEVRREYSVERNGKFEILTSPLKLKQGELVRVDLYVLAPSARNFVVVEDPVPGGLEPLNTDLANTSQVDASKADVPTARYAFWFQFHDWINFGQSFWSFYHKEVRNDRVRFYSEYLEKGHYHLAYTAQAIASGHFAVQPAHAEEMYDPDVYGVGTAAQLEVEPGGP